MRRCLRASSSSSSSRRASSSPSGSSAAISSRSASSSSGLRPLQRDAARQAVPHRAVQRQVGRRAGDRIAGAMPGHRLGVDHAALGQIGQLQVFQEQVDEFVARQGEAEIVLAFAVRSCLPTRRRLAPPCGRGMVSPGDILLVARQQVVADAAAAELRRNEGSCTPCAGSDDLACLVRILDAAAGRALSCTALRICDFARRMKRWRLARFLPLGFRRRSTMCISVPVRPFGFGGHRHPACFTRIYHSTSRRTCRSV